MVIMSTNKIGNKEELSKKNRCAIKKVPKYLELSIILRIFAPSERKFGYPGRIPREAGLY